MPLVIFFFFSLHSKFDFRFNTALFDLRLSLFLFFILGLSYKLRKNSVCQLSVILPRLESRELPELSFAELPLRPPLAADPEFLTRLQVRGQAQRQIVMVHGG